MTDYIYQVCNPGIIQGNAFGVQNKKQQKAASEILESADYLANMVNELLDEAQLRSN